MAGRLEQIQKYRDVDNLTLKQIGQKLRPAVTAERVRQILEQRNAKQCTVHKTFFEKQCYKCKKLEEYDSLIEKLKRDGIWDTIQKVKKHDRSALMVSQRYLVVRKLKVRYKLSFRLIGRILERDHASIMHLFYQ